MSEIWNRTDEKRVRLGKGSGLYSSYLQADGKYALLAPLIKVPFVKEEVGEVEVKVACSDTVTKIEGTTVLSMEETQVYLHRDTMDLLEQLHGKTIPLLSMIGDFTGYTYEGMISYTPVAVGMDEAIQANVKITPVSSPVYVRNCYSMLKPTAHFRSAIPAKIDLASTTDNFELNVQMKHEGATFTANIDDESVATVLVEDNVLKITGKKEGSAIITLTSALEGYASWKTTILVVVPKAVA